MSDSPHYQQVAAQKAERWEQGSDIACFCGHIMWMKKPSGPVFCGNCERPLPNQEKKELLP